MDRPLTGVADAEMQKQKCFQILGGASPKDQVGGDYVVVVTRYRDTQTVSHAVTVKGADQKWVAEQLMREILLGIDGHVKPRSTRSRNRRWRKPT